MFELNTDTFDSNGKKIVGSVCLVIAAVLSLQGYLADDGALDVIAWVVGIPLLLLGSSLLIGHARNSNQGIISVPSLYACSIVLFLTTAAWIAGGSKYYGAAGITFVCAVYLFRYAIRRSIIAKSKGDDDT